MKITLLKMACLILLPIMVGCAAKTEVGPVSSGSSGLEIEKEQVMIKVECKSAHDLGCRHKGNIYPWNAWLDIKGYDSKDYELKEVVHEGSRATVFIGSPIV